MRATCAKADRIPYCTASTCEHLALATGRLTVRHDGHSVACRRQPQGDAHEWQAKREGLAYTLALGAGRAEDDHLLSRLKAAHDSASSG